MSKRSEVYTIYHLLFTYVKRCTCGLRSSPWFNRRSIFIQSVLSFEIVNCVIWKGTLTLYKDWPYIATISMNPDQLKEYVLISHWHFVSFYIDFVRSSIEQEPFLRILPNANNNEVIVSRVHEWWNTQMNGYLIVN